MSGNVENDWAERWRIWEISLLEQVTKITIKAAVLGWENISDIEGTGREREEKGCMDEEK